MSVVPHPTILRRGVLLCRESTMQRVVVVGSDGVCPQHMNGACALWYIPWADAEQAGKTTSSRSSCDGTGTT